MTVGFACVWNKSPEETWSYIPWRLRGALKSQTELVDLGLEYPRIRTPLKYAYARRRHGRWVTVYQWSPIWDGIVRRRLRNGLRENPVDAVIEVGDLAPLDAPFYIYQDLNFQVIERHYDPVTGGPGGFFRIDPDTIKRRQERENELYTSAAGIFTMSQWLADTLVEQNGVPREKVTVAYAGLTSIESGAEVDAGLEDDPSRDKRPAKLLFVGRDFFRKGGDVVVKALAELRREYSPEIELTVAGPDDWPLAGGIPAGVNFLGKRPPAEVATLYRSHDVFVMPSHFEAFGIVFVEALANGLPVIGRSVFAMPEIITPGENGALVDSDDPSELAAAIVSVLENRAVRESTARNVESIRERFSWDAVAGRMLDAIKSPARPA